MWFHHPIKTKFCMKRKTQWNQSKRRKHMEHVKVRLHILTQFTCSLTATLRGANISSISWSMISDGFFNTWEVDLAQNSTRLAWKFRLTFLCVKTCARGHNNLRICLMRCNSWLTDRCHASEKWNLNSDFWARC